MPKLTKVLSSPQWRATNYAMSGCWVVFGVKPMFPSSLPAFDRQSMLHSRRRGAA